MISAIVDFFSSRDTTRDAVISEAHAMKKFQELEELKTRLGGVVQVKPRAAECLDGTRNDILSEIEDKIKAPIDNTAETMTTVAQGPNVIWIRGAPGSGKSSLSLTIKSRLHKQGSLLAYFRFDRNNVNVTTASALWCNVAYELADRYPSVLKHNLSLLRSNKVNLTSTMDLFSALVEDPLSKLTDIPYSPLVIVVDALDECGGFEGGSSSERRALLYTLGRWSQLPKHFKLIVTSREEGDIHRILSPISFPINVPSGIFLTNNPHDEASISASMDICTFLEDRFRRISEPLSSLPRNWPGKEMVSKMVRRAAGNFMWATTAANFIESGHPDDRLKRIMDESIGMEPLHSLYFTIFETSFGNFVEGGPEAEVLGAVLGTIIFAQRPLSDDDYTKLPTTKRVDKTMIELIRDRLRSVVDQGSSLQFVHKSLDDFLLSENCPPKYRIRTEGSQYLLAKLCLTTMTVELHFNICCLKTSYFKNSDVPDIEIAVRNNISTLLSYSCCFWADHLIRTSFDEHLMSEVREVILDKLLYWFEAMSLLEEITRVSHSLLSVLKWSHPSPDEEFKEFVRDACQFIGAFGQPIAQSAPHLYVSALPFAPEHSLIARHFLPRFPQILSVSSGKSTDWSPCIFTFERHERDIQHITFSPDGKSFVSGFRDGTICISDSETGNLIAGPFEGKTKVRRVFFDPDGRRVWASHAGGRVVGWDVETGGKHIDFWAGDALGCCRIKGDSVILSVSEDPGTVVLWSADTGETLHDLRIDDRVDRVSLSPNGCYIACVVSSGYKTVQIWKLLDENEIRLVRKVPSRAQPEFKHTAFISCLSFSVDGNFVVSGSYYGTILIWDASTGYTIGPPLDTEKGLVRAVAYSHDSRLLASVATGSNSFMVWNSHTGEAALGPPEGHTLPALPITQIALSCDGGKVLTVSGDRTVMMWDLSRKDYVPAIHHKKTFTGEVKCLAFSPCGGKLASPAGSLIYLWDASTGEPLPNPIIDLGVSYTQIIFSPDGGQIVAFSNEGLWPPRPSCSIQICNVNTGKVAFTRDLGDNATKYARIEHAAFRQTDKRLITCFSNGVVRVWSLAGGDITEYLSASSPPPEEARVPVRIVALSPDGLTAILRDDNRTPCHYIWSTTACQPLPLIFVDDKHVTSFFVEACSTSPSGQFFAVMSINRFGAYTLRIWNTQTGEMSSGPSTLNSFVRQMAFSPDGSYIAFSSDSSTTTIWIWDVRTGRLASGPWHGHTSDITALAFSPDGEKLVSGSRDGQIRVWNAANLLKDSQGPIGFLGDGVRIQDGWVTGADGKLRCWIPMHHREKLAWNGNVAVLGGMGDQIPTHVDLTKVKFGENWAECFGEESR